MTVNDAPTPSPVSEANSPGESSVAESATPAEATEAQPVAPAVESQQVEAAATPEAAESQPAEGAAASEAAEDEQEGDDGDESDDAATPEGEARADDKPGEAPKKKKRRRKKKRREDRPEGAAAAHGGDKPPHKSHRPPTPFHTGEEVFGKVTAVLETAIMIDLSGKALAIFDRTEMEPDDLVPAVGDRFVARVHGDGARGGLVVLTRKPLREEESKPKIEQAHKEGVHVQGLITGVIKGGVEVDLGGLRAFAPASGMDLHPANANFAALVGSRMDFKVVQYEKAGRDVVVTRRPMLEAEAHERRKLALGVLQEGQVMNGVVRTVVEWGVFVALPDAENLEGLVHVSEASHDPRAHLGELFKPGDRFEVKIVKIDERGKIWLSRKALVEDPWAQARQKYAQGTRHHGKVVRVEKYGAYVELGPEIEGMIHVADLSLERVEHAKELVQEGQELDVVVNYFDVRSKKITLHPALAADKDEPQQKVIRNGLIKAEVVKGEAAGVVVRVLGVTGRQARGFIPAGQTGTARGTDLRKVFKPGTVLDLKVLDVDPRSGEPKLSISGFKDEEERRAHREYSKKVKAEAKFGTLGDLLRAKLGQSTSE